MKYLISILVFLSILASNHSSSSAETIVLDNGLLKEGTTLLPLRSIFEELGAHVTWDGKLKTVTAKKGEKTVVLQINSKEATVNSRLTKLEVPPLLIQNTTMIPVRFVSEAFGAAVFWNKQLQVVEVKTEQKTIKINVSPYTQANTSSKPRKEVISIKIGTKAFTVKKVEIPKGTNVRLGLSKQQWGTTSSLAQIVKTYQSSIGINGTYFEAYGGIPEPWGTLIRNGKVLHIGNVGTAIGFTQDGKILMDTLRIKVEGATEGSYTWPNNWYAYNFNRTPRKTGTAVIIFTPDRGKTTGIDYGTSVIVDNGIVRKIVQNQDATIPSTGFVINFTGAEKKLAERFRVGMTAEYRITYTNHQGERIPWDAIDVALGAGPRLIQDGVINVNPASEGFVQNKILTLSGTRSGIGVKQDGTIIIATASSATMKEWAAIFHKLGAYQAMNLDGGASTGLYFQNKYLTPPGRNISNALLFD